MDAHLSASNRLSARLDALRALDAHVAQSTAHRVMLGLLAFAWFMFSAMAPVIFMDQLTSWLIHDRHWPLWLHRMTPLMAVGPGSVLVWLGALLGPKLFSLPFVNLIFAAAWANVIAYLMCALPYLFAAHVEVPFRRWTLWQQLTLPAISLFVQLLFLVALVEFFSDRAKSREAQASSVRN